MFEGRHWRYVEDGAVVVSGASKRHEFPLRSLERRARRKILLPRTDGLGQRSFTYVAGRGKRAKRIHVLGDGWPINHNGSLAGTPMEQEQLELAIYFEMAVRAARRRATHTGKLYTLSTKVQERYFRKWVEVTGLMQQYSSEEVMKLFLE
jgi:hypothetical protein